MTREEQIKKQADIYIGHQQDLGEDISITNKRDAFIKGAKWADKTMIDKACDWLKEKNKMCMYELEMILGGNFIEDLKKYWRNNYG